MKKRRAVVLVGAGASVDYGIPATVGFTKYIDGYIENELKGNNDALNCYSGIKTCLTDYYSGCADEVNFERIYHAINVIEQSIPSCNSNALSMYKPILLPFIDIKSNLNINKNALMTCSKFIIKAIYEKTKSVCTDPSIDISPLGNFLKDISSKFVARVYTTNYDNFFDRATKNQWISGFDQAKDNSYFNPAECWENWDENCLFHLHGSINFGFSDENEFSTESKFVNYKSLELAYDSVCRITRGPDMRMDGATTNVTPIITGLDKVDKIQQSPFSHYYACFSQDVMIVDFIFVLGAGFSDLHINNWISEARKFNPDIKVIIVDYFKCEYDFMEFIGTNENFKKK